MSRIYVQSEGTAARRRFPVYLVDATDGITPETGESAGQPQISKAGGAWANTTATLTAIGNGAYYVELTATELDTLGSIQVRYKSANTAEFNMDGEVVAINIHDAQRAGLTALPAVNSGSAGGLITSGTGTSQLSVSGGRANADLTHVATVAVNTGTAQLGVNVVSYASGQAPLQPTTAGRTLDVSVGGEAGIDWANIGTPGSTVNLSATTTNLVNTVTTYTGNTPQTGDSYARIGATGSGLTSLASAANLAIVAGYIDTEIATLQTDVTSILQAVRAVAGTADSGSTTTMVDAARTEADADYWKGAIILFTSGNIAGQARVITDFNAGTDTFTFAPATTQAVSTQNYIIIPHVSAWDDVLAEHLTSGSTGAALNAAGSAGDPWNTALPGAYGAGTAGKIVGDNLNATVGSRASQTSVDTLDDFVDTEVAAIKAKTDNLPSDPADASDIAASFATVNSTLLTIAAYIDTEVAAIKAKTDNLPSDPADASDIAASFSTVNSTLSTIAGYIDTEVAAIKAKTDNLPTDPADQSALEAAITAATSGLATAANLATLTSYVDTEVGAIKAKTDNLPAAPAAVGDIPSAAAIVAAIFGELMETGYTFKQATRLIAAACAGKLSGAQTATETFRSLDDSANRITATVDASGNRSAVVHNA